MQRNNVWGKGFLSQCSAVVYCSDPDLRWSLSATFFIFNLHMFLSRVSCSTVSKSSPFVLALNFYFVLIICLQTSAFVSSANLSSTTYKHHTAKPAIPLVEVLWKNLSSIAPSYFNIPEGEHANSMQAVL